MANSDKNIRITTSKNKTTYPNIVFTGSAAGSSVITLEVLDDNTLSFTSNEGQVFSIDSNLSSGTIWAVSDISGVPMLSSSAGGTVGLATYGGIVGIGQTNPTYKLDLKGSFGLASSNDGLYNFIFSNSAASGSNSFSIRYANSLLLYNSGNTFYTGFKSRASADKLYLLPATDGSSGQFLQTDGNQNLTWATATGGAGGGSTGVGAGGQWEVAVYPGTGASVIGYNTLKNDATNAVVSISHATVSTNYSNGALTVSGGVGIGGSLYVGGIGASIVGVRFSNSAITAGSWNGTVVGVQYGGTGQNLTGLSGVLTISGGTVSNSTTSSAIASALSDETGAGSLVFNSQPSFGTGVTTGDATFAVFNTNATTINAFGAANTISLGASTGKATFNSTDNSTSTTTGSLAVSGGAGFAKSISIGGYLQLFSGSNYTAFVSSASGNTVYILPASTPATGSSVLQSTSTGVMSWVPMVASSTGSGSGTVAIPDAQYRLAYYAGTGASVSSTNLITAVGSGVSVLGLTNATSNTVAAFTVTGGLGITGNAFIGGTINAPSTSASNISNIIFANGIITSGTWSATSITAYYGGTGFNTYTSGDILVGAGNTFIRLNSGTTNYVLTSTGTNSVPSWQAVPASAASSVAAIASTSNQSFFVTTVSGSSVSGVGLSTILSFVVNPSTGLVSVSGLAVTTVTNSISSSSGALTVTGGVGIGLTLSVGGSLNIYNGANYSGFRFAGTNNTTYTLPVSTPGTGSSVLQSDSTGVMSWVPMVTSSSSGTVNSGTANYAAYYATSTTAVSSNANLQFTGTGLSVGGNINSTSTSSGSLYVWGGIGVSGNTYIGGNTNVTSNTVSSGVNSGALVVTGGVGIGGSLFTATGSSSSVSGVVLANNTVSASTYNKLTITAPTTSATLTVADGSTLATSGANSLTLTTTALTNATFPSGTVTLAATNVTSLGSLTSASSLNTVGTISTGTWAATAITAFYGGTGYNSYTKGDILVGSGNTFIKQGVGTDNYVLTASNASPSGVVWAAVPPSAATSVAASATTVNSSYFITTVSSSSVSGVGLSTIVSFVVNPSTGLVSASGLAITGGSGAGSTTTGAFTVVGGVGIGGTLYVGGTISSFGASILTAPLYTNDIRIGAGGNNINFTDSAGSVVGNFNTVNGWFRSAQTTEATSIGSGALVSLGGLGIAKNAFIGGTASVTSSTASTSFFTGALVVTGGVGIGGSLFVGGTGSSISGVILQNGNVSASSYNKIAITAPATSATLTLVNGSTLATSGANTLTLTTTANSNVTFPTAGTLLTSGATSPDFITSITTSSASFSVFNANANTINAFGAATILSIGSNTGKATFNSTDDSSTTTTGSLAVSGGAGIAKSLSIGGRLQLFNGANYTAFVSSAAGNTVYTLPASSPATGSSVLQSTSTGVMSWVPMTASSGTVNSGTTNYAAYYASSSAAISQNANLQFTGTGLSIGGNIDSTSTTTGSLYVWGGLGISGNSFIGGTVNITSSQASISTISGALVASGGVGIGLSVSVGGRLQMFNGANYTAFVSAASGNTVYRLPASSPATGSSVLQSTSAGVMSWVPMATGSGSPAGTNNGDIQYKFGSAFQASANFNYDETIGTLSVKNWPGTTVTSTDAALKLLGSTNSWSGSNSGTFVAINAATGFAGDLIHAQVNGVEKFRVSSAGAVKFNNAFTFPTTDGTANQVLQTNGTGTVSWATVTGSSSGGTVYAGSANQIAYYAAAGNTVIGSATFTNTVSTGTVNITHTTPSSSTSTGALVVSGSIGVGGSIYVGGQINQTFQPTIGAAIDHALFMQSNPVATTVGALIQIGSANKWDGTTAGYFTGSFNGTYIGINAPAGNTADFLNFQQNGQPVFKVGLGGTNFQVGSPIGYQATDVLASFASSATNYNQVILQNLSKSTGASADFVISNDISTDTAYFGNFGMNSSTFTGTGAFAAPSAVYVSATSGPLVLGTTTAHPIRFVVNGGTTDVLYISESGTAISCFTNFGMRSASDLRFWNIGNTNYAAIQGGGNTANYTLTLPVAPVATGSSLIVIGTDSLMYFVGPGSGIAFSNAAGNVPSIRSKNAINLQFCTGFTPVSAGADTAIIRIPESATDGTSVLTYNLRRFQVRVETPSAGSSRLQLERSSTDTGAFALAATGSSHIGGLGVTITGAGIYLTSVTTFAGSLVTSGNLLRLNWTLLNATHANFSVNLILEEV